MMVHDKCCFRGRRRGCSGPQVRAGIPAVMGFLALLLVMGGGTGLGLATDRLLTAGSHFHKEPWRVDANQPQQIRQQPAQLVQGDAPSGTPAGDGQDVKIQPTDALAVDYPPLGDKPVELVEAFSKKALNAYNQEGLDTAMRDNLLNRLVISHLDLNFVGLLILGPYRKTVKREILAEYQSVLKTYIPLVFSRRFAPFHSAKLDVDPEVQVQSERFSLVVSTLTLVSGQKLATYWRLRRKKEGWLIVDLILENLSLADSLRQEFQSTISQHGGGVKPVIELMREQSKILAASPLLEGSVG